MPSELEKHFVNVIQSHFPSGADFHARRESDDICIYVDWKLNNDPSRPNKRSKKIKVCISRSAIDDYEDGSDQNRKSADAKLSRIVAAHLKAFNPDHSVPAHIPVPVEQWTITTEMLNM